jgi:hypothetical protein
MQLLESTYKSQSVLASYCRTGKKKPKNGVNTKNVSHYRRLVFNIVDDMLQSAYPLTYNLLTDKEWKKTVNDFFSGHPCQSPQVWYMPKEFYQYLSITQNPVLTKYPFLDDLLLFEWTEVELFMMEDIAINFSKIGDVLFSKLIINPEHLFLQFNYPVHKKKAKLITESDKGNYFLVAHRHPDNYNIFFTDLSAALAKMLDYLANESLTVKEIFGKFQQEFNLQLSEADCHKVIRFFENALKQKLIVGFKNESNAKNNFLLQNNR